MSKAIELTVLIPCLNESRTIGLCIEEAKKALLNAGIQGEVLVADNGSTDNSIEIATQAGARIHPVPQRGYGSALIAGIYAAQGRFIVMADGDCSYDFKAIPKFLERLRAGTQLVVGCRLPRYGGQIEMGAMPWLHRYLGNPVLSLIGKIIFRSPIHDFHCGMRGFDRDTFQALKLRSSGMEFASEMIVKASLANLRIDEIPITLRKDRRDRPPHLRTWRDGWRHLRFLLLYSPRWLFLYPALVLMAFGLFGFIGLLPRARHFAGITFDTNTLLVCAGMLLIGVQLFTFALIGKTYGVITGLLPSDTFSRTILRGKPFEVGIILGMIVGAGGLGLLLRAIFFWASADFGTLSYPESLRIVIPSITLLCLSTQLIFGGFIMALITLHREEQGISITGPDTKDVGAPDADSPQWPHAQNL
jgi:glycosyltransferase involved in cell wall biosynthesis